MSFLVQSSAIAYNRGLRIKPPPGPRRLHHRRGPWACPGSPSLTILFSVVVGIIVGRSYYARAISAIGQNARAAWLANIPVERFRFLTYVASAMLSAICGILLAGFSGGPALDMGSEYLLGSIAVVVIGGTSVAGGRASVPGIWGAALFMFLLVTMLNTFGASAGIRLVATGLIIIAVIAIAGGRRAIALEMVLELVTPTPAASAGLSGCAEARLVPPTMSVRNAPLCCTWPGSPRIPAASSPPSPTSRPWVRRSCCPTAPRGRACPVISSGPGTAISAARSASAGRPARRICLITVSAISAIRSCLEAAPRLCDRGTAPAAGPGQGARPRPRRAHHPARQPALAEGDPGQWRKADRPAPQGSRPMAAPRSCCSGSRSSRAPSPAGQLRWIRRGSNPAPRGGVAGTGSSRPGRNGAGVRDRCR